MRTFRRLSLYRSGRAIRNKAGNPSCSIPSRGRGWPRRCELENAVDHNAVLGEDLDEQREKASPLMRSMPTERVCVTSRLSKRSTVRPGEAVRLAEDDAAAGNVRAHDRLAVVPGVADAAAPEVRIEAVVRVAGEQTDTDLALAGEKSRCQGISLSRSPRPRAHRCTCLLHRRQIGGGDCIRLGVSREVLANLLGLARGNAFPPAVPVLRGGFGRAEGKDIVILDVPALQATAAEGRQIGGMLDTLRGFRFAESRRRRGGLWGSTRTCSTVPEWMSEALRIGNTGLWAIEVDEENGKHRMTANETMLLLLGLETHPSPEDCFRHWYGRVDEAYRAAVDECVGKMLSTGQRYEVQYPWLHPYAGVFLCAAAASCCPDAAKNGLLRLKRIPSGRQRAGEYGNGCARIFPSSKRPAGSAG